MVSRGTFHEFVKDVIFVGVDTVKQTSLVIGATAGYTHQGGSTAFIRQTLSEL
jgi:hypothetical protein